MKQWTLVIVIVLLFTALNLIYPIQSSMEWIVPIYAPHNESDHIVLALESEGAFNDTPTRTFYACVSRNVCLNRKHGLFVLRTQTELEWLKCPPVHVMTRHDIDTDSRALFEIPYRTMTTLEGPIHWETHATALVMHRFYPFNFYHALINDWVSMVATWRRVHEQRDHYPVILKNVPPPTRTDHVHVLFLDEYTTTTESNIRIWNETGFFYRVVSEYKLDVTTCYPLAIIGNGNMDTQVVRNTRLTRADMQVVQHLLWYRLGVHPQPMTCRTCSIPTLLISRPTYRCITNVADLERLLHQKGFAPKTMVFSSETSLADQAKQWVDVPLVVSMHGAELSYITLMRPGSAVLEMFMYRFHSYAFLSTSQALGHYYYNWTNLSRGRVLLNSQSWPAEIQAEYHQLPSEQRTCLDRNVLCEACSIQPSHALCHFLKMYQDTSVDLVAIGLILDQIHARLVSSIV